MQQLLGQSYHKLKLLSYLYPGDLGKIGAETSFV